MVRPFARGTPSEWREVARIVALARTLALSILTAFAIGLIVAIVLGLSEASYAAGFVTGVVVVAIVWRGRR